MEHQIDGNVKEERSKKLIELSDRNEIQYNQKYIGKKVKVLFEDKHTENGINYIKGHTTNYIVVKAQIDDKICDYSNTIQDVEIIGMNKTELIGKII